jgi:hypothetical protein
MNNRISDGSVEPVSVLSWLGTILAALVPLINIIVLLYWLLGRNVDTNSKNFSRAGLIVIGITTVIIVSVFYLIFKSVDPQNRIKAFMMLE